MRNYIYIGAVQMINGIVLSSRDRTAWLILKQHDFFACTTESEGQNDLFRASN